MNNNIGGVITSSTIRTAIKNKDDSDIKYEIKRLTMAQLVNMLNISLIIDTMALQRALNSNAG